LNAITGLAQICQLDQQSIDSPCDAAILSVLSAHRDQLATTFKKIKFWLEIGLAGPISTVGSLAQDHPGAGPLFELTIEDQALRKATILKKVLHLSTGTKAALNIGSASAPV
jgi:hypothetical protein